MNNRIDNNAKAVVESLPPNQGNTNTNNTSIIKKLKTFLTDFRLWLFLFVVVLSLLLWFYFKKCKNVTEPADTKTETKTETKAETETETEPTEPIESFQNKSDPEGIEINSQLYAKCSK